MLTSDGQFASLRLPYTEPVFVKLQEKDTGWGFYYRKGG